jgi:hypothetical protein
LRYAITRSAVSASSVYERGQVKGAQQSLLLLLLLLR